MMIDRREAQRLGGLERELPKRFLHIHLSVRDRRKQIANALAPHATAGSSSSGAGSASSAPASRARRYSPKMPSTSESDVTAWSRFRRSADPGSPLAYQPRCFRNS